MDVLVFIDNSGSISTAEFDAAQQAIANIATSVLSRPGYRLAAVNWGCDGEDTAADPARDGCRIDLATGSAIPGGWSSNPADFAYAGINSSANTVCRSFGHTSSGFGEHDSCGGGNFNTRLNKDFAQHALKMLDGVLYGSGGTGGTDSYGDATVAPAAPSQRLMIIHLTDAENAATSRIREVPGSEAALGDYYYSNHLKNVRNALIVGVGIDRSATFPSAAQRLGALASKGGAGTNYDTVHASAPSTQTDDVGAPRLATYSTTFGATEILAAAESAFDATIPACVVLRKQSVGDIGSFSFTGGTNGLPASLTLTTTATTNPAGAAYTLTNFNVDTSIQESIPAGWAMSGVSCVDAASATVPVTSNPTTGLVTIPGSQITTGAQLTCTVTNTRVPPAFPSCTSDMYLSSGTVSATGLNLINVGSSISVTPVGSGSHPYNAMGFNPVDLYLYGIMGAPPANNRLIQIGADGSTLDLGPVTGLPNNNYISGTISDSGTLYVLAGGASSTLYSINLTTRTATPVAMSQSVQTQDLAWIGGLLYAVQVTNGQLRSIHPVSGVVADIGSPQGAISFGATYGSPTGLFASSNGDGRFYRIDLATGVQTLLSDSLPSVMASDGANCPTAPIVFPADLTVTKTNTPDEGPTDLPDDTVTSGTQTTYRIVVGNQGPFPVAGAIVRDEISAGLTDCELVAPACAVVSGTATCPEEGTGAGQLSIGNLLGPGGVSIPLLRADSSVAINLRCTVD